MSRKGVFFVYMMFSLFFIASFSYVDALLSDSTTVNTLIQIGVRIIWMGGAVMSLIIGVIQLGRK